MATSDKQNIALFAIAGSVLTLLTTAMVVTAPQAQMASVAPKAPDSAPAATPVVPTPEVPTAPAPVKPAKVSGEAAQRLFEQGKKDLLWAIDDPNMGYLSVLDGATESNNVEVFGQVREEIWLFVENNYSELPDNLQSDLEFAGIQHLDCRMRRVCPPAPKFTF